ncbi:MAG: NAD+ synthetase [Reichenbachiella sp.]
MSQVKIGGATLNQTPIDWSNNIGNILHAIDLAKKEGVKVLCLPELCIPSYGCQDLFLHEWVIEEGINQLKEIIPQTSGITVAVGLPLSFEENTYNTTCIIQDEEIIGFYAKQFLANDGIHYEKRWFTAWPQRKTSTIDLLGSEYPIGELTFELYGLKVGLEICEDAWHHTDRPGGRLHQQNVQLIINPSASHFSFNKKKTRDDLVISSSKQFNCHYLYVNQLGNESGRVIYDGDIILANKGLLLLRNKRFAFTPVQLESFVINTASEYTIEEPELDYKDSNEEFTQAASLALFDYMRKSFSKGYVLSLSGGADSSSIATLVSLSVKHGIEQLGVDGYLNAVHLNLSIDNNLSHDQVIKDITQSVLFTAYQGTENSGEATLNSAKELANSIGAKFAHWTIDDSVINAHQIAENAIGRKLSWKTDDIAMQNIQARTRSPLIWMLANIEHKILLTTSNRSEGDVGYTTMDGDTSGSLAPIAGVDKPFLLQWLKYAEKELGYKGLQYVNSLTPTAELRPKEYSQTDEDDLMPYDLMVKIERLGIFQRKSPLQVFETLHHELTIEKEQLKLYIGKFYKLWSINQWKRERLAPSFHLDDFNVDPKTWCRFPILSGSFKKELEALNNL